MQKNQRLKPSKKSKPKRREQPLYFAAKISDYQFKRLVWHFVLDDSAAETAQHVRLSANSITSVYAKLRAFFYELGAFHDPYAGRDPRDGYTGDGYADIELMRLEYHLARVSKKRGRLDAPLLGPDHHFAESHWRFDYKPLAQERGHEAVHPMMYNHLMEFVGRFGPVGKRGPVSRKERREALELVDEQLNRIILWMERNSVHFRDPEDREELKRLRAPTTPDNSTAA